MSYHARRLQTPGASKKRKEREVPKPLVQVTSVRRAGEVRGAEPEPVSSSRLLAGYMAFEFLTKGTLLGEKYDQARAESSRDKREQIQASDGTESSALKPHGYAEVSSLLKSDGAHIPGIVNPTQLARWIQK